MDFEMLLRSTLVMLDRLHVMGSETDLHAAAKKNIKTVIDEIKKWKETQKHDEAENEKPDA